MTDLVKRPKSAFGGDGLLCHDHFQVCHVTNDIEAAKALYRAQYGIREFQPLVGELPEGGHMHIELAWVGGTMYELMTARGPGSEPYMEVLPEGEAFALRFHHFGYCLYDPAEWDKLQAQIARAGAIVRVATDIPGFLKFCIVEVPALGHFLEFFLPEPAGIAFFESVPAN